MTTFTEAAASLQTNVWEVRRFTEGYFDGVEVHRRDDEGDLFDLRLDDAEAYELAARLLAAVEAGNDDPAERLRLVVAEEAI